MKLATITNYTRELVTLTEPTTITINGKRFRLIPLTKVGNKLIRTKQ